MRKRLVVILLLVIPVLSSAQPQLPTFEIASVKRNTSGDANSSSGQVSGGAFSARNSTAKQLLLEAFRIPETLMRGGPNWIESERFDVDARPNAPVDSATSVQMLQALLIDRFKLRTHRESIEVEGYSLIVAPRGAKLELNTDAECKPPCGGTISSPTGRLTSRKVPLSRFAARLAEVVSRPVVDNTGLTGEFNMQLEWAPEPSQFRGAAKEVPNDQRPSLFTALEEQLGLRLVPQRVRQDVLMIDSIERPTPN
jgi:uncharacterized protein (TIGR03435 family)